MNLRQSLKIFGLFFLLTCVLVPLAVQAGVYIK